MASTTKKLPKIQREIDRLKFKIDELCDKEIPHLGAASPDRKSVYDKCNNLSAAVYDLVSQIGQLSLKDEKLHTSEFEARKSQESRRLALMKEKLEQITSQLEPDEMEEDYLRNFNRSTANKAINNKNKFIGGHAPSVSDANSVDGRNDMEDDEDYETDESVEVYRVEAFADFPGERPGDLQFKKGDILTIIATRDDGWWTGEDKDGKTGLVPSTLLKILDEEEEDESEENVEPNKIVTERPPFQKKRSGKDLWQSLKMSKSETTVTDVLKAMKAVPSGFRSSTLGAIVKQEQHKTSFWLAPKLSSSNLSFRDLFWDPVNKKLRPRNVKLTRTFSLVGARCIPPPGAGLEIKSRHVRMSFWDGANIYGNVHTVRAIATEKDESNWGFTPRLSVFLPSLYDGECIARINSATERLALLFELNYSYVRTTTEEKGELSAGWCTLPLFENDGTPIVNKNYELQLRGGTPFEKGIDVDSAVSLKTSQSLFQSLIRTNRQPRLIVKLTPLNRVEKAQHDLLPDLIITCERHVKFILYYRELLATKFLKDREPQGGYICDAVLANFCKAFDFSDLVDALQMMWNDRSKMNLSRSQKRDPAHMLRFFRQCFIESTYSIMQNVKFPSYVWANESIEQERIKFITAYLAEKNSLAMMFSPASAFRPFNAQKVAFDVLSNKCLLNSDKG